MTAAHNPFIEQYAKGRTFVDVGGLWGTVNEKVSVATKAGASSVAMIDVQPKYSQPWQDCREHCRKLGVSGYKEFTGNRDNIDLPRETGTFEFVHCSGVVYHCPNPIWTLRRLHALTEKYLLVGSMTVPEHVTGKTGTLHFDTGSCLFIPGMSREQKQIVSDHYGAFGIRLANVSPDMDWPWYHNGEPNYAPWWWLWTGATLAGLVRGAGFRVLDVVPSWQPHLAHAVFAEKI